jgi:hypothetical protein
MVGFVDLQLVLKLTAMKENVADLFTPLDVISNKV